MADQKLTALTATTTPAATDIAYVVTTPGGTPASKKVELSNLPLAFAAWVDYSSSTTLVGFASTTTKSIKYKVVGKMIFVTFSIQGTSNASTFTFTVPTAAVADTYMIVRIQDNTSTLAAGLLVISGTTVTLYINAAGAAWQSGNTKAAWGEFFYEIA